MKTLREVKIGETVKVVKLHGEGPVKRRIMQETSKVPNGAQAKALKKASAAGMLTGPEAIRTILCPESSAKPRILKISTDRLLDFFPPDTAEAAMEETILAALRDYKGHLEGRK